MKFTTTLACRAIVLALLCLIATSTSLLAQMRVGLPTSTPDGSAALEISSGPYSTGNQYRGMAPPKVALSQTSQTTPINKPTVGLLVYNTATQNDLTPGYYYWDGAKWLRFTTASSGAARVAAVNGQDIPAYLISQVSSLSSPDIIYIADEGKEGMFRYQPNSTEQVNNATVLAASNGQYIRVITEGVNVRWFGAKGTGVASDDDTQAIQKAIDFAASSSGKYSTVYVPSSFTCLVYTVVVKPGISLELKQNSALKGRAISGGESAATPIVKLENGANLYGLGTVDGNKSQRSSPGVKLDKTTQPSFVRDITVINCTDGIWFQEATSVRIQNCIFRGNTYRVIQGVKSDNAIITGNFIDGGEHGIQWYGIPDGDQPDYCENWTISNNVVKNLTQGGIWGYYGKLITVTANNVENCGDVGIDPEYSQDVIVSANTVKNCVKGGLATYNACQRITFADNIVWQQAGYGPGVKVNGNNAKVNEIDLIGKTYYVKISGGNILMDNDNNAIETMEDVAEHLTVEGVTIISNGTGQAIRSLKSHYTHILNSKIKSKSARIVSIEGGTKGKIEGNTIEYTGTYPNASTQVQGIYIIWLPVAGYTAKYNTVVHNRIINCNQGIVDDPYGDNASYTRIEDNETPLVKINANPVNYTGFVKNNRNENNDVVDGSNKYMIKPSLNLGIANILRFDGTNWVSAEPSVNALVGADAGYYPFLTLPASADNTYDNSVVEITLGGWQGNSKKTIRLKAGQRGGLSVTYTVLGSNSAPGSIVAHTSGGVTTFYALVDNFSQINVQYINLHGATGFSSLQKVAAPTGNPVFNSADSNMPPALEVSSSSVKTGGATVLTEASLKTGTAGITSTGTDTYQIAHGLGTTPVWYSAQATNGNAASVPFYITADQNNIIIHYTAAPQAWLHLTFNWAVKK